MSCLESGWNRQNALESCVTFMKKSQSSLFEGSEQFTLNDREDAIEHMIDRFHLLYTSAGFLPPPEVLSQIGGIWCFSGPGSILRKTTRDDTQMYSAPEYHGEDASRVTFCQLVAQEVVKEQMSGNTPVTSPLIGYNGMPEQVKDLFFALHEGLLTYPHEFWRITNKPEIKRTYDQFQPGNVPEIKPSDRNKIIAIVSNPGHLMRIEQYNRLYCPFGDAQILYIPRPLNRYEIEDPGRFLWIEARGALHYMATGECSREFAPIRTGLTEWSDRTV